MIEGAERPVSILARPIASGVSLAPIREVLMARKVPVPEDPGSAVPPIRPRRGGGRPGATRMARPKLSQQAELPDLLAAFWGDRASDSDAQGSPRVRSLRGALPEV